MVASVLCATDLRVALAGRTIIRGVDLETGRPELLAMLGPNGAGKTTLLKVLAGLLRPAGGEILLEGRPLADLPAKARARRIAFLPQLAPRSFAYSVREFIGFGRAPHSSGWHPSDDRTRVGAVLKDFEIESLAEVPVTALSGGELQLVRLARAVVQATDLILLDEPTAALDLSHQARLASILHRLRKEGKSIVLSTHDPTLALRICDRIALLHPIPHPISRPELHPTSRPELHRLPNERDSHLAVVTPAQVTAEQLSSLYLTPVHLLREPSCGPLCFPIVGE